MQEEMIQDLLNCMIAENINVKYIKELEIKLKIKSEEE